MKGYLEELLNLFYPRLCLLCDGALVKSEELLCTHCQVALPHTYLHEQRSEVLFRKLRSTLPIEHVLAYLLYQKAGSTQKLLQLIKYKNYPELAFLLGRHFGSRLKGSPLAHSFDCIIPVPLHTSKQRQRGYNQSERFAEGLAESLQLSVATDWIVRTKPSATQTRKSRLDRWLNVADIFVVPEPERLKGKRVLLVDDVVTTGATLEACGEVLLKAGCSQLSVGAIAVA